MLIVGRLHCKRQKCQEESRTLHNDKGENSLKDKVMFNVQDLTTEN